MKIDERFDQRSHFEFGKNWQSYLSTLTEDKIRFAKKNLTDLIPADKLKGASFFDIGCGSGLHSLCALELGVSRLEAMDFDPESVAATTQLLEQKSQNRNFKIAQGNILTLKPASPAEQFDIVYSWGVLHHTGDMWDAVRCASRYVKPGGWLAIALYQKTWMCGPWKILKKIYNSSSPDTRLKMEKNFSALKKVKLRLAGKNPEQFIADYNQQRGMNWDHDIVDWLGGYPYESASPKEIIAFIENLGFQFIKGQRLNSSTPIGFFGSGCGEFVFQATHSTPITSRY